MKLQSIHVHNFRRFKGAQTVELDPSLTVIAAVNGAGKTTLLDAAALLLGPFLTRIPKVSGNNLTDDDICLMHDNVEPFAALRGATIAEAEAPQDSPLLNPLRWDRVKRVDQSKATEKKTDEALRQNSLRGQQDILRLADYFIEHVKDSGLFPVLAYYGTGRAILDVPERRRGFGKDFPRFTAYAGCLSPRTNFRKLFEYFYFLEDTERREKVERGNLDYQNAQLTAVRQAITSFLPEYTNPHTVLKPLRFMLDSVNDHMPYSIEMLSDGYKTSLAMVMDIAIRMVEANPDAGVEALQASGIVLIDEIELHLHPSWQQRIIGDLRKTFPKVQFICTTHSPQVLSTVPPECIRTISESGVVAMTTCKTYGAESKRILEELMHVESRPPIHKEELRQFIQITDAGDWSSERYHELRSLLVNSLGETDPVLIEADIKKSFQELEIE
jgi:predicted ATP-binding protein involved in virulence